MIDFKNLATKYQTPLYAYDFDYITARYTSLKEAFSARKSLLCYAVKANSNLSVLKHFASLGSGADCVSIGEIKRALLAGIPKYKIIFSGVGKSDYEIKEALKEDILFINIESVAEFDKVEQIAQELNIEARISIRVNPNIDPQTHPYISTGLSL
jgi:diaminopimelate decarboxylase